MTTITARPKAAKLIRPCCSCKAAEAAECLSRCAACHTREWRAAYRGEAYRDLRRVLALAKELSNLADDVADELPATRFARFEGEDTMYHILRALRTLADVSNYAGGVIDSDLLGDPADR